MTLVTELCHNYAYLNDRYSTNLLMMTVDFSLYASHNSILLAQFIRCVFLLFNISHSLPSLSRHPLFSHAPYYNPTHLNLFIAVYSTKWVRSAFIFLSSACNCSSFVKIESTWLEFKLHFLPTYPSRLLSSSL